MRIHDDRPGAAGGYPDDRNHGRFAGGSNKHALPPDDPGAAGTRQLGDRRYAGSSRSASDGLDHYDDDAYTFDQPGSPDAYYPEFYDDPVHDAVRGPRWNGGTDFGLLVLRLALGAVFIAHGAQKLFGVLGGSGIDGVAAMLGEMGFEQTRPLAIVTGVTEFGGGLLLVLGLFTPLAAAGLLGVMANAIALRYGAGFFASSNGIEYELMLGSVALGLLFTGPGRVAVDNGWPWFRRPIVAGMTGLVLAAAASVTVLVVLH